MSAPGFNEKRTLLVLKIDRLRRQALAGIRLAAGRLTPMGNVPPERLLRAPQDIRTADPTVATDLYAGTLFFCGQQVETNGLAVFEVELPSEAFGAALHGFSWLRHLRAADRSVTRAHGRALVKQWAGLGRRLPPVATTPEVSARRLLSLLQNAPFLLEDAEDSFYRLYMRLIGREMRRLWRRRSLARRDLQGALVTMAVAAAAAAIPGGEGLARRAARGLSRHIGQALHPDGGPVSRNAGDLPELLLDLLSVRQLMVAREIALPTPLSRQIRKIYPMIRFFRLGDGGLARFHGAGGTRSDLLATVLAHDPDGAPVPRLARETGFARLAAGHSAVLVDLGGVPVAAQSLSAHASANAFEWSHGERLIVINCGTPSPARSDWRALARETAAHSTLTLRERSSAFIYGADGPLLGVARARGSSFRDGAVEGRDIECVDDGYLRRHGVRHLRRLSLSEDGNRLEGHDALVTAEGKPPRGRDFPHVLRFHLAPETEVTGLEGREVTLRCGRLRIAFVASSGDVHVEESVLFSALAGMRRTRQIVVTRQGNTDVPIDWSFSVDAPEA